jgi:aminoglycoside/choline kinase family phosphotransferase
MPDRAALKAAFLCRMGWGAATLSPLAGDASDRSYDRLNLAQKTAVLMNAPPGKGDDPRDFIRIARHLRQIGLSAPEILAEDLGEGFLLLEDLGDGLLGRCIAADPALELPLYALATDVLRHLQAHPAPPGVPDLSAADWAEAAMLALDWYRFAATGEKTDPTAMRNTLTRLLKTHADGPRVLILRDYHAENLLFLPDRPGLAQLGLLDFQLAQMGQPGYDLVSLLQDARRDVPPAVEQAMIARFAPGAPESFRQSYAVLGVQRALRILGIFARLCLVGGKPGYLPLIPRVWGHLQRNLAVPGLEEMASLCHELLPEPTPETLTRIGSQCARFR